MALRVGVGFESGMHIMLCLGRHFLFTSSDTFAVGSRLYRLATIAVRCIVQPQHAAKKRNHRNFRIWNSHGQRGQVTMAIPDAAFSTVRFCSYIVRRTQYAVRSSIGLDSYTLHVVNNLEGDVWRLITSYD